MENNKMDKHCLITNIDNGGVTVEVKDCGKDQGVFLVIDASYHGRPSLKCEMRVEFDLGPDWLDKHRKDAYCCR
jgi:hypothetical protein